ncbi:MAG TPA: pilus assembly PilX N-terminal domain-containing protein, partial [Candidatus Saccharimonadales bacterium]|nr:pilus assembly PilX N-terminal domain-containing protein [Candidatus Saccharimonadales bacterium]
MNKQQSIRGDERGMVSIMVTLVMIIVITLIVIGFAQVVRRNQRETLDRQLSTQAYYAAETGINDAYKAMFIDSSPQNFSFQPSYKTDCSAFMNDQGLNNVLNNAAG